MPNIVHAQFTHTNAYLTQLIEQFARIDQQIENGETVTINMSAGDRLLSLTVSRGKVVERATPPQRPATGKAPTLADNDSLVAALTKSFSFDVGEANRKISIGEIQSHLTNATASKSAVGAGANLRRTLELPEPAVTYNNAEWVLLDDCRYAALDGFIVTAKRGFKTDLASIPRLLWGFIASFELSLVAPIVHDLIYGSAGTVALPDGEVTPADKRFDRKEADDLFLELMTRSKVAYWKRNVAYLAVRAFGGSSWRQG
ncbi:MAG TPA: DUF1353 domain-containing protein [Nitrospira sp.]|nr:DUF1353 domain-containing protein [Nitrospira sp.]